MVNNINNQGVIEIPLSDIDSSESIEKEMKKRLTDLDRGILLLNDAVISHDKNIDYPKIIRDLFIQNEEAEMKKEAFRISKKRWNNATGVGEVLALLSLAVSSGIDYFDLFYDEKSESQLWTKRVLVNIAVIGLILSGIFTFVCYCISFFHGRKYKQLSKLDLDEVESIQKLLFIIKCWGKLENQKDGNGFVSDSELSHCFEEIGNLPKTIKNEKLPSKSRLASLTIKLLDDDHPLKKTAHEIHAQDDFLSPRDSISFSDQGQQSSMEQRPLFNDIQDIRSSEKIRKCNILKRRMNGVKINKLHLLNNNEIKEISLIYN